jgi:hypothetical protein
VSVPPAPGQIEKSVKPGDIEYLSQRIACMEKAVEADPAPVNSTPNRARRLATPDWAGSCHFSSVYAPPGDHDGRDTHEMIGAAIESPRIVGQLVELGSLGGVCDL